MLYSVGGVRIVRLVHFCTNETLFYSPVAEDLIAAHNNNSSFESLEYLF